MAKKEKPILPVKPDSRIERLKKRIEQKEVQATIKQAKMQQGNVALSQAFGCATEFVGGVGIGAFIGYYLDRYCATLPLFLFLGVILGSVAGFRNMMRYLRKCDEREAKDAKTKNHNME